MELVDLTGDDDRKPTAEIILNGDTRENTSTSTDGISNVGNIGGAGVDVGIDTETTADTGLTSAGVTFGLTSKRVTIGG